MRLSCMWCTHFSSGLADDASARSLDFEMVDSIRVQLWLILFFRIP